MDELALVEWLRKRLPMRENVILGPGDDCALVDSTACDSLAITTDTLLEGTHFEATSAPYHVGWKTLAVSLSDLAGMGCEPLWAVTGAGLRRGLEKGWIKKFAEGLADCAEKYGISLVGGDITSSEGPTSLTLTAVGAPFPGGPLRRDGAERGDILAVTGALGGSIHGRHLAVLPRLEESRALCSSGAVTAMMDISDGLALDLRRLAVASKVGATLNTIDIPIHEDAQAASEKDRVDALSHALNDGEDFELLLAVKAGMWQNLRDNWAQTTPLSAIGICTPAEEGLCLRGENGSVAPLQAGGYIHELD